jgi:hypothetical protein
MLPAYMYRACYKLEGVGPEFVSSSSLSLGMEESLYSILVRYVI